ncbi:MAG: cation diffusion facilitator family transporter [Gammaproteobacteria bacterium]|nr:cation diffusion facilitator family transporter [Gammaproteobacteria bacterium]
MYEHDHSHKEGSSKQLGFALVFTLAFAVVEFVTGWLANSLALIGDAGHMVTDSLSLGLAALAARLAQKPASEKHSFGLGRAEVVAAMLNATFMMLIVAGIVYAAIQRLQDPPEVKGMMVLVVAAIGLGVNIAVFFVIHSGEKTINTRGALLHVIGDLLGSVAALISGTVIILTGWTPIDPILSLFISGLIAISAMRLLLEATHVVMEGVPPEVDFDQVGHDMAAVAGVRSVHDLHVWRLDSHTIALSAHVVVDDLKTWQPVLIGLKQMLSERHKIEHITLQPELVETATVPVKTLRRYDNSDD